MTGCGDARERNAQTENWCLSVCYLSFRSMGGRQAPSRGPPCQYHILKEICEAKLVTPEQKLIRRRRMVVAYDYHSLLRAGGVRI